MPSTRVTVDRRRRALVHRHRLDGSAAGPDEAVGAVLALHATDPASVYLSVLTRSATSTLADVAAALHERRSLVRWMAMRRTVFVVAHDDVPMFQAAASASVAAMLRRRLTSQLVRLGADPPITGDLGAWLDEVQDAVEVAVARRGAASGPELAADVPALRTSIPAGSPSARTQRLTNQVLTIMAADGRLVRAASTGAWTARGHRWEPVATRWPGGLPVPDETSAQRELARRWLTRFGPASVDDLQWWTGWPKGTTRRALADLPIDDIDLHGAPGIALAGQLERLTETQDVNAPPVAVLLPALDPTPMGWTHRDWLFGIDSAPLFDRAGNIGPTLWWAGEIVGSWAVAATGEIWTALVADRGREARDAVDDAAMRLQQRLDGAVVTPAARTPLERSLVG